MDNASGKGQRQSSQWFLFLRPLLWWGIAMLAVTGYFQHQRMMERTRIHFGVIVPNNCDPFAVSASLDGKPATSGQKISLGSHTLVVSHPKTEPFKMQFFGWYGGHDFGQINLKRAMGSLAVAANAPAQRVFIAGPEINLMLRDSTSTNVTVPTDAYTIRAEYPHWSQTQNATVLSGETAAVSFAPQFGALHLTSNKGETAYRLESAAGDYIGNGDLPAVVGGLPVGDYRITATYHRRQIYTNAAVSLGGTNDVMAEFKLGAIHLETAPTDAEVYSEDGNLVGHTPLDVVDLLPGTARLKASLAGYQPVEVALEIAADATNSCQTNLVMLRYFSSLQRAQSSWTAGNYQEAAKAAREALDAKPDDADAIALRDKADREVQAAKERADAERERLAQLKRPREAFDALCAAFSDAGLFDEHEMKTSKPAKEIRDAIVRSLQGEPNPLQVFFEDTPATETYAVKARQEFSLGILGGHLRVCLLVAGKTKEGETEIFFKVLEYQVQHTIVGEGLSFRDEKHLIPIRPTNYQPDDAVQIQIHEGTQAVIQKIQTAIDQ